jgi:transposase-like protein
VLGGITSFDVLKAAECARADVRDERRVWRDQRQTRMREQPHRLVFLDETYIKVRGQWRYLHRAIDSHGDTVEFWFSERRNLTAAKRFLRKALKRHGRPERIVIDGSQTNLEAILSCDTADRLQDRARRDLKPIRIRQSAYLNNRIEQDHRAIKRRVRPMLGFKSFNSARVILGGIEMVHMMRKQQAKYTHNLQPSLAVQFDLLAA